ncbi:MAG: hypothetical protein NC253_02890, partial [Ruminococcus sp.]|nr:hypothetical protein [Ruminococcus sp.]MCM1380341.1 hypothetical protein [Muribaculaceae bacterium]MCM1478349.1 hypothetical protein [Muribaculaceae bacterium]
MVRSFEFGENENPNFIDMCVFEEENPEAEETESGDENSETEEVPAAVEKEGVYIKGRDVIVLDAPEIRFPKTAPLDTEKRELYEILNELFQDGSGGGDVYQVSGGEDGIT